MFNYKGIIMANRPKSTRLEKIKWLSQNKYLWEGFPQTKYELIQSPSKAEFIIKEQRIKQLLKSEGFYSEKTVDYDINIFSLIQETRNHIRTQNRANSYID